MRVQTIQLRKNTSCETLLLLTRRRSRLPQPPIPPWPSLLAASGTAAGQFYRRHQPLLQSGLSGQPCYRRRPPLLQTPAAVDGAAVNGGDVAANGGADAARCVVAVTRHGASKVTGDTTK
jgi:hypothetical protein